MLELTPQQQAFIDSQIAAGVYHNPEEVLQAGLDLLRQKNEESETLDSIKRGLADMEAGNTLPADEAFIEIRQQLGISNKSASS